MNYEHITYSASDGVAWITLNHPEKRNPLSLDVETELMDAYDRCDYDESVRVVVIRGAGGHFSAGGDITVMKHRIDNNLRGARENCRSHATAMLRLRHVRKPVIAWVEGSIAGAGIPLALACDFQIVSETAKCVFAFTNVGYVPDSGSTFFVAKAVGTIRATELFMSARRFSGKEAADWGFYHQCSWSN